MPSSDLSTDQLLYLRTFRSTEYSLAGIRGSRPQYHLNDPRLVSYPTPLVRAGLPPLSQQEVALVQGSIQPPYFLVGSRRSLPLLQTDNLGVWPRILVRATILRSQFLLVLLSDWNRRTVDLSCAGFYIQRQWLRWILHVWLGRAALAAGTRPIISTILLMLSLAFRSERRFILAFFQAWATKFSPKTQHASNISPPDWMPLSPSWTWYYPSFIRWMLPSALLSWKFSRTPGSTRVIWARLSLGLLSLEPSSEARSDLNSRLIGLGDPNNSQDHIATRLRASFITITYGMNSFSTLCDRPALV